MLYTEAHRCHSLSVSEDLPMIAKLENVYTNMVTSIVMFLTAPKLIPLTLSTTKRRGAGFIEYFLLAIVAIGLSYLVAFRLTSLGNNIFDRIDQSL